MQDNSSTPEMPLAGVKVLELGSLIAGPYASALLAQFGAEVIKIEPPGTGDPLRKWRKLHEGTSLWWYTQSRNKKSVTLDLKAEEGQEIVRKLAREADIVVENFRPGTLEKWGIGWEQLSAVNPNLIMVRISGYGQTGPASHQPRCARPDGDCATQFGAGWSDGCSNARIAASGWSQSMTIEPSNA